MNNILSLLILSSIFLGLTPRSAWSNPKFPEVGKQFFAQIERPSPDGVCQNHHGVWVDNCFQGVQWEQVPDSRTFVGGYDEGYSWVGINTISRNGDAINFDFISQSTYARFSANCNTRVYTTILASDSFVDPNAYSPVNEYVGQALDFACSNSRE